MYDVLFKNVRIVDGSGKSSTVGDVAVENGRIAKVGNVAEEEARKVIQGERKVLAPGFIDVHSHSDIFLGRGTDCRYKLLQGVTTEIAGQCGLTVAPVSADHYEERNGIGVMVVGIDGRRQYTSCKKWHRALETMELGTNLSLFVGQGTIRETVMGYSDRPAGREELEEMKALVREAMEAGCQGLSSGLAYPPGNFTVKEEIAELCRVVAEYGGIYATHMKNQADHMLDCVADTIQVARETGCRTVISHIKSIGKRNWGNVSKAMEMIEEARKEGLDVWCDVYPYVAGSTTLTVTLPPSILEGGSDKIVERLGKKEVQEYIEHQFQYPSEKWENAVGLSGLESFLVISAPDTPEAEGKRITEYAQSLGIRPFEAYIKLLRENQANVGTVNFVMSEDDFISAVKNEICMVGSDGNYRTGDRVTHPRSVGTFPRYLGRYARDRGLTSLELAVRKITGYPADQYGLNYKGYIREGYDADLVLFDWDKIMDTADFSNCFGPNEGIEYVIVNGKFAVEQGAYNGTRGGKLIRADRKRGEKNAAEDEIYSSRRCDYSEKIEKL